METSLWVALIGAGGTVLAAAATAILTHIFKPKSEPTDATSSQNRPGQEKTGSVHSPPPPAKNRGWLWVLCAAFLIVGTVWFFVWRDEQAYKERKAKFEQEDAAARLVLSCEEKPVFKFKSGTFWSSEVPAITIKIDRIECRGDVKLRIANSDLYTFDVEEVVPADQSVATWRLPEIEGSPRRKMGIHFIRVEGILQRKYPLSEVKGRVDIRVEFAEAGVK